MIYWLIYKGLILRLAAAAVLSFLVVVLMAPRMIRFLIRKKVGDRPEFDHVDLNQLTRHKTNTPTMGGILIVIAIFVSVVMFANLYNMYVRMALVALIWLGGLGAVDDWLKLRRSAGSGSRDGLRMWEKTLFQVGLAVLLSVYIYWYGSKGLVLDETTGQQVNPAHSFYFPFRAAPIALPLGAHMIITVLTMVGASNAVNLTDGMDGLAGGCMMIVAAFFLLIAWIVGVTVWSAFFHLPLVAGSAELTVVCASMVGALLGFLWYNAHPAQVFMGDTGSLPLGGLIGYIAVVTRQELLLIIVGGVFVMEAGSVLLQIACFKITRPAKGMEGKRFFRCAPVHHHFHLGGWAESKVVTRMWVLGIIFAALAMATLKLR